MAASPMIRVRNSKPGPVPQIGDVPFAKLCYRLLALEIKLETCRGLTRREATELKAVRKLLHLPHFEAKQMAHKLTRLKI